MNILLIQPPVRDFYQTAVRTQPLGLAYLAASLRCCGHHATIFDCQVPGLKRPVSLPAAFHRLHQHYRPGDVSPFSLYHTYSHYGLDWPLIDDYIRQHRPDAVGIACHFTPYIDEALAVAALVKAYDPQIPVIMGGAHASAAPASLLRHAPVDYTISGEGEIVLPRLLDDLSAGRHPHGLPGVGLKSEGRIVINPRPEFIEDLDRLALPARDLLNPAYYTINGEPYTMLITSRGCPQNCTYCSVASVMGTAFRKRSAENIIMEMQHCRTVYGITLFDIEDDNFTLDRQRADELLSGIADTFGSGIQLFAMNGLSLLSLDRGLLSKMQAAGFRRLDLALGSTSPAVCAQVKRLRNPRKARSVLAQAGKLGMPVTTYIILGIPGQRLDEMIDSIIFLTHQPGLIGPSIFYPCPGTALYDELYRTGEDPLLSPGFLRSSLLPVESGDFSRLDLITLLRLVRWINFIKRILPGSGVRMITMADLRALALAQWSAGLDPGEPASPAGAALHLEAPAFLARDDAGRMLTAHFLRRKIFFGIRRQPRCRAQRSCAYEVFSYATSSRVIDLFFARVDRVAAATVRRAAVAGLSTSGS